MTKPRENSGSEKHETRKGYTAALIHLLAEMDFEEARKAAAALGEAADPAAIKALVYLVKESATLRATAIAALKKMSEGNDAAATELAIALLKEKKVELPTAAEAAGLAEDDRRRSPRVLLEIPVVVTWKDQKGHTHAEPTTTRIVNAYGAMLHLKNPMVVGMELEVNNVTTMAKIKAHVVWVGDPQPEGGQEIGIELGDPAPDFWVGKEPADQNHFAPPESS